MKMYEKSWGFGNKCSTHHSVSKIKARTYRIVTILLKFKTDEQKIQNCPFILLADLLRIELKQFNIFIIVQYSQYLWKMLHIRFKTTRHKSIVKAHNCWSDYPISMIGTLRNWQIYLESTHYPYDIL